MRGHFEKTDAIIKELRGRKYQSQISFGSNCSLDEKLGFDIPTPQKVSFYVNCQKKIFLKNVINNHEEKRPTIEIEKKIVCFKEKSLND